MAQRKAIMTWERGMGYIVTITTDAGKWAHSTVFPSLRRAMIAMDLFLRTGKRF